MWYFSNSIANPGIDTIIFFIFLTLASLVKPHAEFALGRDVLSNFTKFSRTCHWTAFTYLYHILAGGFHGMFWLGHIIQAICKCDKWFFQKLVLVFIYLGLPYTFPSSEFYHPHHYNYGLAMASMCHYSNNRKKNAVS